MTYRRTTSHEFTSEGDLFTHKSETLESLLPDIHRHKIALPSHEVKSV
jgi:hypothetical protein